MHYVKHFKINGVDTKQVACIELHGRPNAATEGALGVLGVDVDSPSHDVYKCISVNGSIYTWELLSSGMSVIRADISGNEITYVEFPYDKLKCPTGYVVKEGDLIIDVKGHVYQVSSIYSNYCGAIYAGMYIIPKKGVDYFTETEKTEWIYEVKNGAIGEIEDALKRVIEIQNTLIGGGA